MQVKQQPELSPLRQGRVESAAQQQTVQQNTDPAERIAGQRQACCRLDEKGPSSRGGGIGRGGASSRCQRYFTPNIPGR
jgi:hypothetical protein